LIEKAVAAAIRAKGITVVDLTNFRLSCQSFKVTTIIAKLYLGNDGFACRHCYRLVHTSTRDYLTGRLCRKKDKLETKAIDAGHEYQKPMGMHWKTFERICDELNVLELELAAAFFARAMRILKIDDPSEVFGATYSLCGDLEDRHKGITPHSTQPCEATFRVSLAPL
jgi:hypothetical protein